MLHLAQRGRPTVTLHLLILQITKILLVLRTTSQTSREARLHAFVSGFVLGRSCLFRIHCIAIIGIFSSASTLFGVLKSPPISHLSLQLHANFVVSFNVFELLPRLILTRAETAD